MERQRQHKYKYIGFAGCYTKEGQADPFEASLGGVPHDRTKVGTGVLAIGVSAAGELSLLNDGEPIIGADEVPNPSYLCVLERSERSGRPSALRGGGLCVVSELERGTFHSYSLRSDETSQGGMKLTAEAMGGALDTGGSYPCHIIDSNAVGSDVECIIVSNYGEVEGTLSIFGKSSADSYSRQVCIPFGPGSKINKDRQMTSHAHSTSIISPAFPNSLMDICCADLGSDAIVQFSLSVDASSTDGGVSLKCVEKERLAAPPGSGPRSLAFNPVLNNIAVVSLEMTAEVWLMKRSSDGSFVGLGDPVSVLPENWPEGSAEEARFNRGRWASDALWSPDGKFVYAAARLHNSISVFRYADGGGLTLVQRVPTGGLTPRCLCMSECGDILLVAHQHSHCISSFQRKETDGTIASADQLEVPNAACVKLIRPEQIGYGSVVNSTL